MKIFSIVPEKYVYVLERFGKFQRLLKPGFRVMIPFIDQIAYKQHLMEQAVDIEKQTVITKDNVPLEIDGLLFMKIDDPYAASYKIKNPRQSLKILALTVMRSEIGKLKLDQLLQEREKINKEIHKAVNNAATEWGINCLRYQILNIEPPEDIKRSMEYEVEAERTKRRDILLAEAKKIAQINVKTGERMHAVQLAEGKAEAIRIIAEKEKEATIVLNKALTNSKIRNYILLSKYLPGYSQILSSSNVVASPLLEGGKDSSLAALFMMLSGGNTGPVRAQHTQQRIVPEVEKPLYSHVQENKRAQQNNFIDLPNDEDIEIRLGDQVTRRGKNKHNR